VLSRSRGNNIDAPPACFRQGASLVRRAVMHDARAPPCDQERVTRHLKRLRRCPIASCPAGSGSSISRLYGLGIALATGFAFDVAVGPPVIPLPDDDRSCRVPLSRQRSEYLACKSGRCSFLPLIRCQLGEREACPNASSELVCAVKATVFPARVGNENVHGRKRDACLEIQ
jgi:hypothetical protein